MADYISREAAIKEFCDDCIDREWCKSNGESCSRIKNINSVPAADVVEVVRCGECKHREKCTQYRIKGKPRTWFCGDGEREEK